MGKNPLVSVIVPIYNAELYLDDCIKSILNQAYSFFEIILVDDGSTDNSLNICHKYMKENNNIKVISQKNGGQNNARFSGLNLSKGEVIIFVDADDLLEKNLIEKLISAMVENDSDVVISGVKKWKDERYIKNQMYLEGAYEGKTLARKIIDTNHFYRANINTSLCANAFKRDIILYVFENMDLKINYSEDVISVILACYFSNKAYVMNDFLYVQRMHDNSFTHMHTKSNVESQKRLFSYMNGWERKYIFDQQIHQEIDFLIKRDLLIGGYDAFEELPYLFPFRDVKQGSRIIIYGAGAMGQEIISSVKRTKKYEICAVVDKNMFTKKIEDQVVILPEDLVGMPCTYDYVVIANSKDIPSRQIYRDLIRIGIPEGKIKKVSKTLVEELNLEEIWGTLL